MSDQCLERYLVPPAVEVDRPFFMSPAGGGRERAILFNVTGRRLFWDGRAMVNVAGRRWEGVWQCFNVAGWRREYFTLACMALAHPPIGVSRVSRVSQG